MRRGPLGAMCAVLLWLVLWTAGGALAESERGPPLARTGHLVLDGGGPVSLNWASLYWVDERGELSVDQVETRGEELPWRVRQRDSQPGFRGGALWIRFEAAAPPGEHWVLEVPASATQDLQLFHRDATGAWVRQQAGTAVARTQWSMAGRLPTFRLAADGGRPVRYWLRVQDRRADFVAPLTLLREDTMEQRREVEQFVFGAYFGFMALAAVAALASALAFRDKAFSVFTLYIVLLGVGQLARVGVGPQHLWRDWPRFNEVLLSLWPGAACAAALWLVKIVTDPARLSRWLDLLVWGLIAALIAATAAHVLLDARTSMTVVLALAGLALAAVVSMVTWSWLEGRERHLALLALAVLPVVVIALFPLARGLGLAPSTLVSRFGLFFGTVFELPLLYCALSTRLMLRRDADKRANALTHNDALTGLPHRAALVQRLDSSVAHARRQRQNCALLGVRIANLEAIAEELGRDAVDKALVVAASHLRRASVDYDMAARVGEREFAVLLEAPVTRDAAMSRAQQIVASGLREADALPGLTLKFHVTVSMLSQAHLDGAACVQRVLDELDQLTPDARKLIRPLDSRL
jgi:diguanylate cyclase (GGDEF)-like protein